MDVIFEAVNNSLELKKASDETLQLWQKIWSTIQENGIDSVADYLESLLEKPEHN